MSRCSGAEPQRAAHELETLNGDELRERGLVDEFVEECGARGLAWFETTAAWECEAMNRWVCTVLGWNAGVARAEQLQRERDLECIRRERSSSMREVARTADGRAGLAVVATQFRGSGARYGAEARRELRRHARRVLGVLPVIRRTRGARRREHRAVRRSLSGCGRRAGPGEPSSSDDEPHDHRRRIRRLLSARGDLR